MLKQFDDWNSDKKQIDATEEYLPRYYEREIRWCRLGVNIGFEQDGTGEDFSRPVLILKGFSRRVCLIVPLTSSPHPGPYRVPVGLVGEKNTTAIISQIRLIDTRRLDQHITTIDKETFERIRKAVKDIL